MRFCSFSPVEGRKAVYCAECGKYSATNKLRECRKPDPIMLRYGFAVAKWIEAGRPERTDSEVDAILDQHCSKCDLFKDGHCTHAECGCNVKSSEEEKSTFVGSLVSWIISPALVNKLRMSTEHCPIGKW